VRDAEMRALLRRNAELHETASVLARETANAFARPADTEEMVAETLEKRSQAAPEAGRRLEPLLHNARRRAAHLRARQARLIQEHEIGSAG
jgi:hypothetical protein